MPEDIEKIEQEKEEIQKKRSVKHVVKYARSLQDGDLERTITLHDYTEEHKEDNVKKAFDEKAQEENFKREQEAYRRQAKKYDKKENKYKKKRIEFQDNWPEWKNLNEKELKHIKKKNLLLENILSLREKLAENNRKIRQLEESKGEEWNEAKNNSEEINKNIQKLDTDFKKSKEKEEKYKKEKTDLENDSEEWVNFREKELKYKQEKEKTLEKIFTIKDFIFENNHLIISSDFSGLDFSNEYLAKADFSLLPFKISDFSGSVLRHANFSNLDLERVNFQSSDLTLANLNGSKLHLDFVLRAKFGAKKYKDNEKNRKRFEGFQSAKGEEKFIKVKKKDEKGKQEHKIPDTEEKKFLFPSTKLIGLCAITEIPKQWLKTFEEGGAITTKEQLIKLVNDEKYRGDYFFKFGIKSSAEKNEFNTAFHSFLYDIDKEKILSNQSFYFTPDKQTMESYAKHCSRNKRHLSMEGHIKSLYPGKLEAEGIPEGANIIINMSDLKLQKCNMAGIDLSGIDCRRMRLRRCNLRDALFNGTKLNRSWLLKCNVQGVDFSGQDFSGSELKGIKARNANFNNALLKFIDLEDADFRGAKFQEAKLINCNMKNAKIKGADFSRAEIKACNFENVSMENVKFVRTKLRRLNLVGKNFSGSNLKGASLLGSNLSSAKFVDSKTDGETDARAAIMIDSEGFEPEGAIFSAVELSDLVSEKSDLLKKYNEKYKIVSDHKFLYKTFSDAFEYYEFHIKSKRFVKKVIDDLIVFLHKEIPEINDIDKNKNVRKREKKSQTEKKISLELKEQIKYIFDDSPESEKENSNWREKPRRKFTSESSEKSSSKTSDSALSYHDTFDSSTYSINKDPSEAIIPKKDVISKGRSFRQKVQKLSMALPNL